jgi:hypothetical protein
MKNINSILITDKDKITFEEKLAKTLNEISKKHEVRDIKFSTTSHTYKDDTDNETYVDIIYSALIIYDVYNG